MRVSKVLGFFPVLLGMMYLRGWSLDSFLCFVVLTMCKKKEYFAYVLLFQKLEIRRYFHSWTTMGANTRFSWHGIFTLLNIWRKTFLPQRT